MCTSSNLQEAREKSPFIEGKTTETSVEVSGTAHDSVDRYVSSNLSWWYASVPFP